MNKWLLTMYLASVAGSFFGLLLPILLEIFRTGTRILYHHMALIQERYTKAGSKSRSNTRFYRYLEIFVLACIYIVASCVIAFFASAAGFFVFLQDQSTRNNFVQLGALAYFAAFTNGYSAGSIAHASIAHVSQGKSHR